MQMEAHHYCKGVDDGFFQCAIVDGNTDDVKLVGLEYIISEARFEGLDEAESSTSIGTTTRFSAGSWSPRPLQRVSCHGESLAAVT